MSVVVILEWHRPVCYGSKRKVALRLGGGVLWIRPHLGPVGRLFLKNRMMVSSEKN